MIGKDKLMNYLKEKELEVLLTLGAGDIDVFVQPITDLLVKAVDELV